MDINTKLGWCASYLADRYFANERKPNYEISGYSADQYNSFCVDLALAFICLGQLVMDKDDLRLTCLRLLKRTLSNVDYSQFGEHKLDDFHIEAPWIIYEQYDGSLFKIATTVSIFIFFGKQEKFEAAKLDSLEHGRLIVETLQQMLPVYNKLQLICDIAKESTESTAPFVASEIWDAAEVWKIATLPVKRSSRQNLSYRGNNGACMSLEWTADCVWIKNVESLKPQRGYATELLGLLCRIADRFRLAIKGNAIVYLPNNFADPSVCLSQEKLNMWYQRHGFVVEPMNDFPGAYFILRKPN